MTEILSAVLGAVLGALIAYFLSDRSQQHYEKKRLNDERSKIMAALDSEIRLNLAIAEEVLTQKDEGKRAPSGGWSWIAITPFSDVALVAAMSSGSLAHLPSNMIEPLLQAYTVLIGANYTAIKIQHGQFEPNEGNEYISRVRKTKDMLNKAQDILKQLRE